MDPDELLDVELTLDDAFDPRTFVAPSQRKLGGTGADVESKRIRFRVGRRPVARNLRRLYEIGDRKMPTGLEVFDAYDLWLLENHFSVLKEGGFEYVQQVGMQVRLAETPRCTVLSVLPKTEFVKHVGVDLRAEADVAVDGRLSVPDVAVEFLSTFEELSAGGRLSLSSSASVVGRISFALMSTAIQAIGVGDNESTWCFERLLSGAPLIGDQMVMQVLLTPRRLRKLSLSATVFANVKTFGFVSNKLTSKELPLEAALK